MILYFKEEMQEVKITIINKKYYMKIMNLGIMIMMKAYILKEKYYKQKMNDYESLVIQIILVTLKMK